MKPAFLMFIMAAITVATITIGCGDSDWQTDSVQQAAPCASETPSVDQSTSATVCAPQAPSTNQTSTAVPNPPPPAQADDQKQLDAGTD